MFDDQRTPKSAQRPYSAEEIRRRAPRGIKNFLATEEPLTTLSEIMLTWLYNHDAIKPTRRNRNGEQWSWTKQGFQARKEIRRALHLTTP